jgi:hypothetical protein
VQEATACESSYYVGKMKKRSIAATQYDTFKKQIIKNGKVYAFTQDEEFLVYPVAGKEVIPFWSSKERVKQIKERHPKYQKFLITELRFDQFYKWLTRT